MRRDKDKMRGVLAVIYDPLLPPFFFMISNKIMFKMFITGYINTQDTRYLPTYPTHTHTHKRTHLYT